MIQTKNREPIYDLLRVVSAFFVIVVHVSAENVFFFPIGSGPWKTAFVYDSLAHLFVPIFFMISGRFLLDPDRLLPTGKLIRKTARLLMSFCFFSCAYLSLIVFPSFRCAGASPAAFSIGWLAERFIRGESHLWFLWVLIGLYLITPVLRQIVLDRTAVKCFLLFFAVFQVLFPLLGMVPKIGYFVGIVDGLVKMHLVMGYSGYFVLGWYLHEQRLKTGPKAMLYAAGLICFVVNVIVSINKSVSDGEVDAAGLDYLNPLLLLSTVSLYLAALDLSRVFPRLGSSRIIRFLSSYSFGIYLTHMFAVKALLRLDLLRWAGMWIAVTADALAVMIAGVAMTWLIRRIPWLGKRIT